MGCMFGQFEFFAHCKTGIFLFSLFLQNFIFDGDRKGDFSLPYDRGRVQCSFLSFSTAGAIAKQHVPTLVMISAATSHFAVVETVPTKSDEKSIFHSSYMQ